MVTCVRLLLDGCAETLEALRLYPSDPYSEAFFFFLAGWDASELTCVGNS